MRSSQRTAEPPIRPNAGFTILEAIVAVTIVGVTAVASLAAFGSQLRAGARARVALEAEALAEEQLARLRLAAGGRSGGRTGGQELGGYLSDSLRAGTFSSPFGRYRWESLLQPSPHEAELYDARVTIRWDEGEYVLATRLYRPLRARTR